MAVLKTYSISADITGGELDINTLYTEINNSGHVNTFAGITNVGDAFDIHGASFANEAAVDTIVLNHVPTVILQKTAARSTWIDADKSVANSGTFNSLVCNASPTSILYDRWVFKAQDKNSKNVCSFEFVLRDDYIDGNDVTVEVDWTSSITAGNAIMYIGLCVPDGANFGGEGQTTYVQKVVAAPATSGWEEKNFLHTFSGAGLVKDKSYNFIIIRDGNDGADDLNGSTYIRGIKIMY